MVKWYLDKCYLDRNTWNIYHDGETFWFWFLLCTFHPGEKKIQNLYIARVAVNMATTWNFLAFRLWEISLLPEPHHLPNMFWKVIGPMLLLTCSCTLAFPCTHTKCHPHICSPKHPIMPTFFAYVCIWMVGFYFTNAANSFGKINTKTLPFYR